MSGTAVDILGGTSSPGVAAEVLDGLSAAVAIKGPCACVSVTNKTLAGEQTIDGVLTAASRVLVAGQTDARSNGIYVTSTGDWRRAADFNRNDDIVLGTMVRVVGGSTYAGTVWAVSTFGGSLSTDNVAFTRDTVLVAGSLQIANNLSDLASRIAGWDQLARYDSTQVIAPSAGTLDLSTATSPLLDIGAGNFSAVTLDAGKSRKGRCAGANVITVGGSLIGNNGGANITTAAGDAIEFRGEAAGVVRIIVTRASGRSPGGAEVLKVGDTMTGTLLVNKNAAAMLPTQSTSLLQMQQADDIQAAIYLDSFGTGQPYLVGRRARGSKAAPTALLGSNAALILGAIGYGTTGYSTNRAEVQARSTQTWTDANQGMEWIVKTTPNNSTTLQAIATFGQDGSLLLTIPTGGMGYGTGAGGTIAQATNKATGVTLNTVTGEITLNNAALAAGAIVAFVLTDSAIGAGDVLVLNHSSGGTLGAYGINAACAAGSATIYVRNATAGSLSEAIVLRFALIKGATS